MPLRYLYFCSLGFASPPPLMKKVKNCTIGKEAHPYHYMGACFIGGSLIVLESSSSGVEEIMTSDEKDFDNFCHVILLESVCDTFKRFSQRINREGALCVDKYIFSAFYSPTIYMLSSYFIITLSLLDIKFMVFHQ